MLDANEKAHRYVILKNKEIENIYDCNSIYETVVVDNIKLVEMWNNKIQQRNTNELFICLSIDCFIDDISYDTNYIKNIILTRFLNTKNHPSAPPYELKLKKGDLCILTR
jgi:hypothetical protein